MENNYNELADKTNWLRVFLSPVKSKLRPFIVLFAIKNYILHKNGYLVNNNPSIKWYFDCLKKSGISGNYWGIRRQLKRLADLNILKEKRAVRLCDNSTPEYKRTTQIENCEYYLNEEIFEPSVQALREIFGVSSLSSLFQAQCNLGSFATRLVA